MISNINPTEFKISPQSKQLSYSESSRRVCVYSTTHREPCPSFSSSWVLPASKQGWLHRRDSPQRCSTKPRLIPSEERTRVTAASLKPKAWFTERSGDWSAPTPFSLRKKRFKAYIRCSPTTITIYDGRNVRYEPRDKSIHGQVLADSCCCR